jgi:hypothetical protein
VDINQLANTQKWTIILQLGLIMRKLGKNQLVKLNTLAQIEVKYTVYGQKDKHIHKGI